MRRRSSGSARVATLLTAILLVVGCGQVAGPGEQASWEVPPSIAVGHLEVGDILWVCGDWNHGRPTQDTLIADLYLGRSGPEKPMDRPTAGQLEGLREAGVNILDVFHVPAVRASLTPEVVPHLRVPAVRAVPDRDVRNILLTMSYLTSRDSALTVFRRHGGAVTHVHEFIHALSGAIPDDSLPGLRATGLFGYTDLQIPSCLHG